MSKVMVNLKGLPEGVTLEEVAARFDIDRSALDDVFGVILVDPKEGVHTVLVEPQAIGNRADLLGTDSDGSVEGPFSNPPVAPFGPIQ